jgi:hypothetical protein
VKSNIPLKENRPDASAPQQQDGGQEQDNLDDKLLCLKLRLWWFIFLGLMAFLLILIIGCLATPRWVFQGDGDFELQGGLLKCTDCPGDLDGETYKDIIDDDDYCDNQVYDGLCDTIKKLQGAGGAYLAFSIFTIIVLLGWSVFFIFAIFKKKFPGPHWIPYLFPVVTLVLNFLAIASWGGASEAKFKDKDNCDMMSLSDEEDICATDGPGLALFIFLLLILYGGFFSVIHFLNTRRKQGEASEPKNSKALNEAPKNDDRV